jgi:hypothetical protein
MKRNASSGRSATPFLLVAAIAAGLLAAWRPWSTAAPTKERLHARMDSYTELRRASDWKALFALVDPIQQERVGLDTFLRFCGQEMTRLIGIDVKDTKLDADRGTASIDLEVEHELVPEKLPAQFRRNLKVEDKSTLRQRSPYTLEWVWRDGEWYYSLDRVMLTGRDKEGRPASPATPTVSAEKPR